ncbi:ABC-type nitrate/sulfonate/bicarbonate transport system substrate-binding protein [Paenibacillus cellulosilyticus]|uniref:ABC-type nitrate/sulfonate/bicarbonate transport system substrate-binding protein n=1 Tax=Paenibacillus cellulosilyticus TaxID=375489 RepID=A0A2V2YQX0_9BACL|nr:ABC transporter substrate-binding protein [Paenibacillus cellulosilyticus]PWV99477.1 ABC-type nitrate/sulfonate/bicarbonate transport system substrate-binding protein [Paenibacillus cellulosilyticus]QKS44733.1 ABC transporter substrate-binding protein [Paenibacillus cellulosilyticus]
MLNKVWRRNRNWTKLAAILTIAVALSSCGNSTNKEEAANTGAAGAGGEKEIVEFKYPDNPGFDLVYLADELGYFDGTSTRPKYVGKVAAPQVIPLVGTGDIDFGARMVPLVISAIASGADIKVVSAGGKTLQEAPHMKYFVRNDGSIKTPKDLEGKTIGFNSFGACAEFVSKKWFKEQGVDISKINFLVVPDDKQEQTLEQGGIDLAIIHAPYSGKAEYNEKLVKLWSDYDLDGGLGGMAPYSVNGKFARNHPEAVRDFVSAIAKTANWVNANPEEAKKIIAKRIGIDVKYVDRYAYVDDLVVTEEPIQYYIDILEEYDKIPKGKVSVKDVYTNEFNEFATKASL